MFSITLSGRRRNVPSASIFLPKTTTVSPPVDTVSVTTRIAGGSNTAITYGRHAIAAAFHGFAIRADSELIERRKCESESRLSQLKITHVRLMGNYSVYTYKPADVGPLTYMLLVN